MTTATMTAQEVEAEIGTQLRPVLAGAHDGLHSLNASREDLPALFQHLGHQCGAEIGIERAHFSKALLTGTTYTLLMVDPWAAYRGYREHVSQEKLDGFYVETQQRVAPFGVRTRIVRATSLVAAADVPDAVLDFVYLDANHTLPHVIADLAAWVPKVRIGGIVAGHDHRRFQPGYPCHVVQAVEAWRRSYFEPDQPWFLLARDRSPSFLWVKR